MMVRQASREERPMAIQNVETFNERSFADEVR